jgi:hypothetical protein
MLRAVKETVKKTVLFEFYQWLLIQEGRWLPVFKTKRIYKKVFQRKLNLTNPQTLTEKINWLKLFYYPKDSSAIMAGDKLGLHTFLEERGLSRIASPILYAYDSVAEICWESLPDKFVIKKSNASAFNIIVTDKGKADETEIRKTMKSWMKTPFGYQTGEHHYEKMKPKIVIEKYMENIGREWKIFCINGKPEVLLTVQSKSDETCINTGRLMRGQIFSDLEGKIIDVKDPSIEEVKKGYVVGGLLELPSDFYEMIELSKVLSKNFPFVCVDFYHGDGRLILGELTLTTANGFKQYTERIEKGLGRKLILPDL